MVKKIGLKNICYPIICYFISALFLACHMVMGQNSTDSTGTGWQEQYRTWQNETDYHKTYIVDKQHPDASDSNPGTREKPLLSINKAAQMVKAGERVLIYGGVYREMIEPRHGGESTHKMISYESAPGEKVIIKGSRILSSDWIQSEVLTDETADSSFEYTKSRKIWMTTLPDELFERGYFPFKLQNIEPDEYKLMPWAKEVEDKTPFNLPRGMLFQDGERLKQLASYSDLMRVPGSFWVDVDGKTIHINPYGTENPNRHLFEVAVQSHLFKPQKLGLGYIQVKGLTFKHCANGFLRTSTGALTTMGGHHWIIQDNEISDVNSSAMEFGYHAFEFDDPDPANIQPRPDENLGGVIILNNLIHSAGTAGMRSYNVKNGIVKNNEIWNVGWQDAQSYWECSGIKILLAHNTLVKGNHVYDILGGNGIWMDWDIRHSRVTANIIHDIRTVHGAIFVEASQVPNLVDNNIIWNIDGSGIYANDSDNTLIYHNLVANTTDPVVKSTVATERKLNGRWLTATKNKVYNNVFIDGGKPINFDPQMNSADYNVYVTTQQPKKIDVTEWKKTGLGTHSEELKGYVTFNTKGRFFSWNLTMGEMPEIPLLEKVSSDFYGNKRQGKTTSPGPFIEWPNSHRYLFQEISNF